MSPRSIVWGLGRHGGGVSAARFLAGRGDRVAVVDAATADDLAASVQQLDGLAIDWRLGVSDAVAAALADADSVVVNPAIPPTHPALASVRGRTTSELQLTLDALPAAARVVAVTGSNGKSGLVAQLGQHAAVGGNFERDLIGRPQSLLTQPDEVTQFGGRAALEVSSFQAAALDRDRSEATFDATVITSLTANHLDWHGSMDDYAAAKRSLLRRSRGPIIGPRAVLDELGLADHPQAVAVDGDDLHAAIVAAIDWPDAPPVALPHRRQVVGTRSGVRFVDDSAATTPAATLFTLDRLQEADACKSDAREADACEADARESIVLILGGRNKGLNLDALARGVAGRVAAVATIGETAADLARLIAIHGGKVRSCRTLAKAVKWGRKLLASAVHDGGVLLLSPAMASTDQFPDYRDRGRAFASLCDE